MTSEKNKVYCYT